MSRGVSALACAVLAGAGFICRAADLYPVAGVVMNSETGSGMPHMRVTVMRTDAPQRTIQTTGADGKFHFELAQGKFSLTAGTGDFQQNFGYRTPDSRFGIAIVTGPGHDTAHLTFRWFPPGAISGRIVDEFGDPVESALVQLLTSAVFAGSRSITTAGWARTDDRGEFRFGPLRGGSYFLTVTGTPWYSSTRPGFPRVMDSERSLAYAPVYYPSASDISQAASIVLRPAQEARADFTLSVVRGATVTVKHDAPVGATGLISLLSDGIGGTEGYQHYESFRGGVPFTFNAVPPGRYLVRITASKGISDFSGRKIVDVVGPDAAVELQIRPEPVVSGTMQLKNSKTTPRGLLASLVREGTGTTISTVVGPDGSFSFPRVAVAKWRPAIRGAMRYVVSEVHVDGANFHDGVIDLQDGDSVTVHMTVSDEIGRLQGFVTRGETPLDGVLVVLTPASGAHDQIRPRGFQTDSDGSFDFQSVPAGDYLLFAIENTQLEYTNPAALRPYLPGARRVHIEAHSTQSEKIPLSETVAEDKR